MQSRKLLLMALLASLIPAPLLAAEVNRVGEIVVEESEEIRALQERRESAVSKTVITTKEMEELG
ncbi:hypothetical protein, partial [Geoalkalibacter sp.]